MEPHAERIEGEVVAAPLRWPWRPRLLLTALRDEHDRAGQALAAAVADPTRAAMLAELLATQRRAEHEAFFPLIRAHLDDGGRIVEQVVGRRERLAAFAAELPHLDLGAREHVARQFHEVADELRRLVGEVVVPRLTAALAPAELDATRRPASTAAAPGGAIARPTRRA